MRIASGVTDQYACATCKETKSLSEFGKDKQQSRGHKYSCKECINSARRGSYQKENRAYHLKSKYGMTPEEYHQLYLEQRGCCAICEQPPLKLYVDHCHTGLKKVRGLLCHSCNVALGHFRDDIQIIENALYYLRENFDADT